jgi:hypothetical protein
VNITSVRKDHMRMGIASKLVEMTVEMAKKNACQGIYTQVLCETFKYNIKYAISVELIQITTNVR